MYVISYTQSLLTGSKRAMGGGRGRKVTLGMVNCQFGQVLRILSFPGEQNLTLQKFISNEHE